MSVVRPAMLTGPIERHLSPDRVAESGTWDAAVLATRKAKSEDVLIEGGGGPSTCAVDGAARNRHARGELVPRNKSKDADDAGGATCVSYEPCRNPGASFSSVPRSHFPSRRKY